MSDGNTATTLVPSEEEMNKIAETFAKMRDAVIDASALAQEVSQLRSEVAQVKGEMESLRRTNHWLDSQVTELRQQRDQATRDKQAVLDELNRANAEKQSLTITVDNQRSELHRLNEEVARLKRERDDAEMRALEEQEGNAELHKKLQAIEAVFAPKPEAQPRSESGQFQAKPELEAPRSVTEYPY